MISLCWDFWQSPMGQVIWNDFSKHPCRGYHRWFRNGLILLSIISFARIFIYFLMFSRHLCSHIAQLLNYWSTTMTTMCCCSWSDCNETFITTHCCSNYSISKIISITLGNARDLTHSAAWVYFPLIWKQGYSFPYGGSFDVVVEF